MFGREGESSICIRGGTARRQQICSSLTALNKARAECYGKETCTIPVNEEFLGFAITSAETRCVETSKYLRLHYECIPGKLLHFFYKNK